MKEYMEINDISKSYLQNGVKKIILKNIDFSIAKKEFIVILGPSGCGKTTLLKIAAGFIKTDKGSIYVNGDKVIEPSPDRIMVFQEFRQLFPWKTVLDNVVFALKAKGIAASSTERKELALHYLQKVELYDIYQCYPYQLSGGMKQRVALARALAADPKIMLMDEPFGSLDSQTRTILQDLLIENWQNDQRTILFVTHDIEEAIILADRIIVMDKKPGRIKEIINNNLKRPRNRVSSDFTRIYDLISKI